MNASGVVDVKVDYIPLVMCDSVPRMGMTMMMPEGFDQFKWYGRGPQESYADKKESAIVGIYEGQVKDQLENYVIPQENGNKTDTRWAKVSNDAGLGLLFEAKGTFDVSVHNFTAQDLTKAMHTYDLKPRKETIINIDLAQTGLGNASCGPDDALEPYKLRTTRRLFEFSFKAV